MFNWRILDRKRVVLAVQIINNEARFVVRRGERVLRSGVVSLAANVAEGGRLISPSGLSKALQPFLAGWSGDVVVVLSSDLATMQTLSLPVGLDQEELDFQARKHITQTLGISISEVYYDWMRLDVRDNPSEQTQVLSVARQADVASYVQAFDERWHLRWVCPECVVWMNAYRPELKEYVVCRVEQNYLSLWWVDGVSPVQYIGRPFDPQMMAQAGFVYESDMTGGSAVQLPLRFVVDEIVQGLSQWRSVDTFRHVEMVYGLGLGVDWLLAQTQLQKKLGVPVRSLSATDMAGLNSQDNLSLGGVWYASKLVLKKTRLLNVWPSMVRNSINSVRRLLMESVFACLFAALCVAGASMWFFFAHQRVKEVNAALQQEVSQLQVKKISKANGLGADDVAYARLQNQWHEQRAGQLNWLLPLAASSSKDLQYIQVRQGEKSIELIGLASNPKVIGNNLSVLAKQVNSEAILKIVRLERKSEGERSLWRFDALIDDVNRKTKASSVNESSTEPVSSSAAENKDAH